MPLAPARGYLTLARFRGSPVRVHWTTPLGAFVGCGLVLGLGFEPFAWGAFVVLVLVHELGHAVVVRRCGLRVLSIDVHALGGICRYEGRPGEMDRAKIAWGGVVAQALLLVATTLLAPVVPPNAMVGQIVQTWTAVNVLVALFNLLPFRGLDGAEAWLLFRWRNVRGAAKKGALEARRRRVEAELEKLAAPGQGGDSRDDRSMMN